MLADLAPNTSVKMSEDLASLLGFELDVLKNPSHGHRYTMRGAHKIDTWVETQALYLYCDVLESIPVGDTLAPLLRIVDANGEYGQTLTKYYKKPRYIPLQKKNFDTLEIDIRNDLGEIVSFEPGKLVVTLHFRQSKAAYFLG